MTFALLLVGLPAAAGLAGLLFRHRGPARWAALIAPAVALCLAVLCAIVNPRFALTLADFGSIRVDLAMDLSPTTAAVAIATAFVTLLVQLYSAAYLRDDPRYAPFAAQVNLFCAAMLLVVTADDLVFMLIGWEVMGACSYLLIAHYAKLPEAPGAAAKAFLVTRFGDVAFVLGVMVLGASAGTFRVSELNRGEVAEGVATAAMLLILFGCIGKSAQFPLQIWLPPAMAGPTPVSALIHAATMVAAGAYVLTRLLPVWPAELLLVVAVVAAVTMVGAGLCALAARDLKGVLAWSTVSQVGFMFAAVAVAAADAALFHLVSHAAFKGLLFLTAGVVIALAGTDGSLRATRLRPKDSPLAFWAMTIGLAAMAGLPPLDGFYSKEAVLGAAYEAGTPAGVVVFWAGVGASILTAAYAARLWLLLFWRGEAKTSAAAEAGARSEHTATGQAGDGRGHPGAHDGGHSPAGRGAIPNAEAIALWALMIATVGVGALYYTGPFDVPPLHLDLMALLLLVTLGGFAVIADSWWRGRSRAKNRTGRRAGDRDPASVLGRARPLFAEGVYAERLAGKATRSMARAASVAARALDERLVDRTAVEGSARATLAAARDTAVGHRGGLVRYLRLSAAGTLLIAVVAIGVSVWNG
ncbi:NADH-quinone oxidoreductase subunit L [Glycomyces sp. TRM65418]|uniref:NADH-quinone oxidoreductase subunit 5 family protein n=1 Tax=Glycomyces sp. TRM65418 TaxID=2867006 RepID=UPI001CE58C9A|nr:proton-conducting transporter membrane subunit [Glycomyces sp. TRM65418]MCC3762804.1 NADH-quinone oxidoreductase subunit L [Glycomyces sp. TRM65418]QZD56833.1 NADH-quinone oxidoreductase subunit L [Glycomyces sp. TRM65418]